VLKAYGVPKSSLGGAGAGAVGYANLDSGGGGSKVLDGGGSKYSLGAGAGAGAGAGMGGNAGAYGSYPVSVVVFVLFYLVYKPLSDFQFVFIVFIHAPADRTVTM
jgi:hypothetical protein